MELLVQYLVGSFWQLLKSSYSPYLYPPYLQPYPPSNKRMISRKSEKTSKTGNRILNKTGTVIDLIFCAIVIFYGILSHKLIKIESYQYKYKATTTVIHGWILDKRKIDNVWYFRSILVITSGYEPKKNIRNQNYNLLYPDPPYLPTVHWKLLSFVKYLYGEKNCKL